MHTRRKDTIYLVEMTADQALRKNIIENALLDPPHDRIVRTQMLKRLEGWYARNIEQTKLRQTVNDAMMFVLLGHSEEILQERIEDESAQAVDWPACLNVYRQCLSKLRDQFGLPEVLVGYETRLRTE